MSKKLIEQNRMIEDLSKKIRVLEFHHKQEIKNVFNNF